MIGNVQKKAEMSYETVYTAGRAHPCHAIILAATLDQLAVWGKRQRCKMRLGKRDLVIGDGDVV